MHSNLLHYGDCIILQFRYLGTVRGIIAVNQRIRVIVFRPRHIWWVRRFFAECDCEGEVPDSVIVIRVDITARVVISRTVVQPRAVTASSAWSNRVSIWR